MYNLVEVGGVLLHSVGPTGSSTVASTECGGMREEESGWGEEENADTKGNHLLCSRVQAAFPEAESSEREREVCLLFCEGLREDKD